MCPLKIVFKLLFLRQESMFADDSNSVSAFKDFGERLDKLQSIQDQNLIFNFFNSQLIGLLAMPSIQYLEDKCEI